jgi:hypothetical protein
LYGLYVLIMLGLTEETLIDLRSIGSCVCVFCIILTFAQCASRFATAGRSRLFSSAHFGFLSKTGADS